MGLVKDYVIKKVTKQIKVQNNINFLRYAILFNYITASDLLYKDNEGITLLEHILGNEDAYCYISACGFFETFQNNPDVVFLLSKHNLLHKHPSTYFTLEEDALFSKYEDEILLHYIIPYIENEKIDEYLFKINQHSEIIDYLISQGEFNRISKLNPELANNVIIKEDNNKIIEKYINNDYVFVQLMKLIEDKKIVYELCKKYNKLELLNVVLEDEFIKILEENKSVTHFNQDYFEMEAEKDSLLDKESLRLIKDFIKLFESELSKEQLDFLYDSVYQSLINENEKTKTMIATLIEIKKEYPDYFKYTFDSKKRSEYNDGKINFFGSDLAAVVFYHENGHLLEQYGDKQIPILILNQIIKIRSNPEKSLKGLNKFKELYKRYEQEAYIEAKKYSQDSLRTINQEFEQYLMKLDLPEEILMEVKNISNLEERYVKKREQVICNEYVYQYLLKKYPQMLQISDILDAILGGDIQHFDSMHGHGIEYYDNVNLSFMEIVACFISLMCLPNSEKYLEMLKDIIGETLFYEIKNYCDVLIAGKDKSDEAKTI